jgi:penicillin amidase
MTWRRRLTWLAIALIGGGGAIALGGNLWLRTSLPTTSGTVEVPGIGAAVAIERGERGIVTIRAASETDAAFALGFAHAQDRLFQMDFMRRIGAGRLSEVMGAATVDTDIFMRTLGLYRAAEANLPMMSPAFRATLEAYSKGVNAFLDSRGGALPPEFQLLRYRPEHWRPADSLVWGKLMAFQLSGNWSGELLRYRLSRMLEPEMLRQIWPAPDSDPGLPIATKPDDSAAGSRLHDPVLAALQERPLGASNSFVLAGNRTASGKPILGNDPHLALQSPSQWYLVRIETPELTLAGATAPGVPQLIIGHNGKVAWSFTTTQGDTQDLFVERPAPDDPQRYLIPGGTAPFEVRHETIRVDGGDDIVARVRQSRHGPILSDAPSLDWGDPNHVLALAWPALNADDGTADALFRMNRAGSAAELRGILADFDSPQQNVLFADIDGNIGFVAAGRVPIRKALHAASQMPAPGWTGAYDWSGFLPFDQLPNSFNPTQGWVATANNKIVDEAYPHFLAGRWEAPYRIDRLRELLLATPRHDLDTAGAIQMDSVWQGGREYAAFTLFMLSGGAPETSISRHVLDLMKVWDGQTSRDRMEPLFFWSWLAEFNRLVFADELGPLYDRVNTAEFVSPDNIYLSKDFRWCDNSETLERETCAYQARMAIETVLHRLSLSYGSEPSDWRWGTAHQARLPHPIFDRIPVLRDWLHEPVESDGDNFTLNRGTFAVGTDGIEFPHVHGPGLRVIFDLADLDRSRFIIAGGQSGNPLSPYYRDQVDLWRDGQYLTIVGGGDQILTLMPVTPKIN